MNRLVEKNRSLERVSAIRAALPKEGLFAEKDWLISPESFPLTGDQIAKLDKLGHRLNLFTRACNNLYQLSAQGRRFPWVAPHLDRGKPPELIEIARNKRLRNEIPQVIRPDIVLTEHGFKIAELDSVPGGIGLTAWLSQRFSDLGDAVIGGREGMLDGFDGIFPNGDILVSKESATYRPEMEWLACQLDNNRITVHDAERYDIATRKPAAIYRFFENFDLPNIPPAETIMKAAADGEVRVTPPFKPHMEEKMWFAFFWMRPLWEFWRRELGERHWRELQKVIPYTWIVDPQPLPNHAVIPNLNVHSWQEVGCFSQKERDLILKISGFSDFAWGSRGVELASDLSQRAWQEVLKRAVAEYEEHPYILQRFHKGRLFLHPYQDRETGEIRMMEGRVRLCPYYFIVKGKSQLKGVLATICPADKKLLHGMKDAILVPAAEMMGNE
jgi:hypothetical protein